jgi:hypothetical protein
MSLVTGDLLDVIFRQMAEKKWKARSKRELIIEAWEHLDCESVGAGELESIAKVVRSRYGDGAVDSPASTARLLADEGAELRHAEVLELDARTRAYSPYQPMLRNVLKFSDFKQAIASVKRLENLRKQFERLKDREGLRIIRETAQKGRQRALMISRNPAVEQTKREQKAEIAEWFAVWLRQPEIFEEWVELRQRSNEFQKRFGK